MIMDLLEKNVKSVGSIPTLSTKILKVKTTGSPIGRGKTFSTNTLALVYTGRFINKWLSFNQVVAKNIDECSFNSDPIHLVALGKKTWIGNLKAGCVNVMINLPP